MNTLPDVTIRAGESYFWHGSDRPAVGRPRVSASLRTDVVLDALEQAIYDRCANGTTDLVHHSDRGTQYLSMRYSHRLGDVGARRFYEQVIGLTPKEEYAGGVIYSCAEHRRLFYTTRRTQAVPQRAKPTGKCWMLSAKSRS